MLSASFNQNSNQGLIFNLSDNNPMNDFGYHENYNPKTELFNQYFNTNQDSKMYSISEIDHSQDFDLSILSSRLQSMGMKTSCNMSRSNSAHNSPFDSRITPRLFSQSTSNTPIPIANRMPHEVDMMRGNPPIMQLFNNYNMNRQSPVELIEYQSAASKMGFLVGQDLEEVLSRSATMKNSNSSRISNFFKHKHGSSGVHSAVKQYLVLGVRVPSKEHVSEIVGKEGKKIKMIRQTTGALIATPNEKEDHVFLIEAVPDTALKVGQIIQQLADQISRNKLGGIIGERPRSPPVLGSRTALATAMIGVPQRLVGKVIGTQGSIITTVQKETGTEIKSPPKDELRAPEDNADFEISVYENGTVNSEETAWLQIHRAKQLIAHLVMRVWDSQPRNGTPSSDEGCANHQCMLSTSPEWIWPEVARMDDGDAKEIVDRILRSSKAKITPSTSSTEGGVCALDASPPPASTMTTMYHEENNSWPMNPFQYASQDSHHFQQQHRSSFYNDSAFYPEAQQPPPAPSSYYSYENNNGGYDSCVYQHVHGGYHHQQSQQQPSLDQSWNSHNHHQQQRYHNYEDSSAAMFSGTNLKNIWSSTSTDIIPDAPDVMLTKYGTIGDHRRRFNSDDEREDL